MLCQLQLKQEESDRRHDEIRKMYDDLAQKFAILQEFVASNVGCTPEEALTYANVAAAPNPTTTATATATATATTTATATATPAHTSPNTETAPFTPVRNGATPTSRSFLPTIDSTF
ncbi:hypothetical protein Pmani_020869 [Petrolisthes manimaculis]|uniref:Uncharacterized protein n=1 Tax=Petrolisthes manimaculis TaxID=1843537 RepID=A0AAE1U261_9EUCA|nr:hypothetical protein Pmani_020857 [Petrolisthes manimaculis]KAK4307350.1 hypothetical protein Pmani_020869 [Petrolisthes manimaculis]